MRRLQAKEDERAKKRRKAAPQQRKRERVGFRQFLREVRQELKKVAWPTRDETATFTIVVLVVTAAVTAYTFALDFGLKNTILQMLGAAG